MTLFLDSWGQNVEMLESKQNESVLCYVNGTFIKYLFRACLVNNNNQLAGMEKYLFKVGKVFFGTEYR